MLSYFINMESCKILLVLSFLFLSKETFNAKGGLIDSIFDIILFLKMEPDYSSEWDDMCV